MWLTLYVLNNCFNDKSKTHLGLKFKDVWYCITHYNNNIGVKIPKKKLKMRVLSKRVEYLKKVENSAPNVVNITTMKIHESVLTNYEINKLDSLKNKQKRFNHGKKK